MTKFKFLLIITILCVYLANTSVYAYQIIRPKKGIGIVNKVNTKKDTRENRESTDSTTIKNMQQQPSITPHSNKDKGDESGATYKHKID